MGLRILNVPPSRSVYVKQCTTITVEVPAENFANFSFDIIPFVEYHQWAVSAIDEGKPVELMTIQQASAEWGVTPRGTAKLCPGGYNGHFGEFTLTQY